MIKKRIHWTNCYVCGNKLFHPIDIEEGRIVKCGLCHNVPVNFLRGVIDQEIHQARMEAWK